jgi:hypothetical protein
MNNPIKITIKEYCILSLQKYEPGLFFFLERHLSIFYYHTNIIGDRRCQMMIVKIDLGFYEESFLLVNKKGHHPTEIKTQHLYLLQQLKLNAELNIKGCA